MLRGGQKMQKMEDSRRKVNIRSVQLRSSLSAVIHFLGTARQMFCGLRFLRSKADSNWFQVAEGHGQGGSKRWGNAVSPASVRNPSYSGPRLGGRKVRTRRTVRRHLKTLSRTPWALQDVNMRRYPSAAGKPNPPCCSVYSGDMTNAILPPLCGEYPAISPGSPLRPLHRGMSKFCGFFLLRTVRAARHGLWRAKAFPHGLRREGQVGSQDRTLG